MDIATALQAEIDRLVVEPMRSLGLDDAAALVAARMEEIVDPLAAALDGGDEKASADAAEALAFLTEHPRPLEWWSTPLGSAMAVHTSAEITPTAAGELLGLSRIRIYQLLKEQQLERGPGGGIAMRSIARFRARRRSRNGEP